MLSSISYTKVTNQVVSAHHGLVRAEEGRALAQGKGAAAAAHRADAAARLFAGSCDDDSGARAGGGAAADVQVLVRVTPGDEYIKLVLYRRKVIGAMLLGSATELAETFENLILNKLDVGAIGEGLLDPAIDIADFFD